MASEKQVAPSRIGHALVNLTTTEPSEMPYPNREIRLAREPIKIGRASKVEAKGFVAAKDNCWFDSAVMSREHAELAINIDGKEITIKDTGSLHGTFVNNEPMPLPNAERRPLKNGDHIRFGIPIVRGTETYTPASITVGIQFSDEAQGRVFRAPESVDGDCSSDDGSVEEITAAELRPNPATAKASAMSQQVDNIRPASGLNTRAAPVTDLTSDDDVDRPRVVDLTSPSRALSPELGEEAVSALQDQAGPDEVSAGPARAGESSLSAQLPRSSPLFTPQPPRYSPALLLQYHGQGCGTANHPESVSSAETSIRLTDDEEDDILSDESHNESMSDELESASDASDSEMDNQFYPEAIAGALNSESESESDYENHMFGDTEEEYSSDENGDDYDQNLWDSMDSDAEYEPDVDMEVEAGKEAAPAPYALPPIKMQFSDVPSAPSTSHSDGVATVSPSMIRLKSACPASRPCDINSLLNSPGRQNSPSNVAMAKSVPSLNPVAGKSTAEVLGPKTGKEDYFWAREENKCTMAQKEASYPSPPNAATRPDHNGSTTTLDLLHAFVEHEEAAEKMDEVEARPGGQLPHAAMKAVTAEPRDLTPPPAPSRDAYHQTYIQPLVESRLLDSGNKFLNSPPAEDALGTLDADDDDDERMVSAATFHQHKLAAHEKRTQKTSLKRKADEISSSAGAGACDASGVVQRGSAAATIEADDPPAKRKATAATKKLGQKKKKKAWAVAEKVGFAALGGVMVLGSLIYTAPSFA